MTPAPLNIVFDRPYAWGLKQHRLKPDDILLKIISEPIQKQKQDPASRVGTKGLAGRRLKGTAKTRIEVVENPNN